MVREPFYLRIKRYSRIEYSNVSNSMNMYMRYTSMYLVLRRGKIRVVRVLSPLHGGECTGRFVCRSSRSVLADYRPYSKLFSDFCDVAAIFTMIPVIP